MPHGPYRLAAALIAASVLALTACTPSGPAASPTPTAEPSAAPTPAPDEPATRPVNLTGTTCGEFVPLELLEAAAGTSLRAGGAVLSEYDEAAAVARWENAGGFRCTWADAASGEVRAVVSVLPDGAPAGLRIGTEIGGLTGDESMADEWPLATHCIYDHCSAIGYLGDDFANATVFGLPWTEDGVPAAEMIALGDAVVAGVRAMPQGGVLPPLSEAWIAGPTTCDAIVTADDLAAAIGAGSVTYKPGYAYEESSGADAALLTAGGIACRYGVADEIAGGLISVLPDAEGAFRAAAALPGREPASASDTFWTCRRNGPTDAEASVSCTVDVLAAGAWITVASTAYEGEDLVRERALAAAAVVAGAL
ncbi:hypothetical protein ACWEOH_13565 [Agromyces sp. NPDC004153]